MRAKMRAPPAYVENGPRAADTDVDSDALPTTVPFPALVVISPGRPETVLGAFGCLTVQPGVYHAVSGLVMRVVVLAELLRTRETLLLRLLGSGQLLRDALADLAALPGDVWERSVATPLLLHFRLESANQPATQEDDVDTEMKAWWEDYQQKQRKMLEEATEAGRNEGRNEGLHQGRNEGLHQGLNQGRNEARKVLLRLLRKRFGELPAAVVGRIEAAGEADIELWADRVLDAKALSDVLDTPS